MTVPQPPEDSLPGPFGGEDTDAGVSVLWQGTVCGRLLWPGWASARFRVVGRRGAQRETKRLGKDPHNAIYAFWEPNPERRCLPEEVVRGRTTYKEPQNAVAHRGCAIRNFS